MSVSAIRNALASSKARGPHRQAKHMYGFWVDDEGNPTKGDWTPMSCDPLGHGLVRVVAETNTAVNFNPDAMGEQIMAGGWARYP